MTTPELLAPAGSPEALVAAVQNGANAVYLAYGDFNARRNAKNFSAEEFADAVSYCHLRGVLVYLTLNTLLTDRELPSAQKTAAFASSCGVDAIIVQDIGLVQVLRQTLPDTPLHASTQMTIHNLPGVLFCQAQGMTRVVLSRELSRDAIASLCQHSPVELEVFSHGALCMCYSGQCFFSSLVGERSGNRGLCAQPCRLAYRRSHEEHSSYPLSLKDLSLANELKELSEMGVSCLKLEGRMKRPEYVATITNIYADLLREKRPPTQEERRALEAAFSRDGFTQGYYHNKQEAAMFGRRREGEAMPEELLAKARASYTQKETPRVPIRLSCLLCRGEPAILVAEDSAGHCFAAEGPVPEDARNRPLEREQVITQLQKTGGTVFSCEDIDLTLDSGLSLPISALNALRRVVLAGLEAERSAPPTRQMLPYELPARIAGQKAAPVLTLSLLRIDQLSDELLTAPIALLYLPIEVLAREAETITAYRERHPQIRFGITLPRIVWDSELPHLRELLKKCRALGIEDALIGNWGLISLCREEGFHLRGDFGLGIFNSASMQALYEQGFSSATASFELNLAQIRDLSKPIDTEFLAYGRLSMMLTEHCLSPKGSHCKTCSSGCSAPQTFLEDRKHEQFPIVPAFGGRSELLNAKTLFLADRMEDYRSLGLWAARLSFTTEDRETCLAVVSRYLGQGDYSPDSLTRGLYYRRAE